MTFNFTKLEDIGAIILKDILSSKDKDQILKSLVPIFSEYIDSQLLINSESNSFIQNQNFHNSLISLRKDDKIAFSDLYDKIRLSASLRSIFYSKKFLKIFSKILKIDDEKVFLNGFMLRLDTPSDKRNTLGWHQDSPYYRQTLPNFNAYVCWLPLSSVNKNNGSIIYAEGSHKEGYINKDLSNQKNSIFSKQQNLNVSKKYRLKNFRASFGDLGIFHMNLMHRSGFNSSKKIRISLGVRCHDMSKNFNIGKEVFQYKYIKGSDQA